MSCQKTIREKNSITEVSQIFQHHLHLSSFVSTSVVSEVTKADLCLWGGGGGGGGGGIQGYCLKKHGGCGERLEGDKQSRGSVCLGFLRGDSNSQSRSNGNQLTANKAIARPGLFAFVVDFWRGGLLFIVLYSPKPLKRRLEKFIQGWVYSESTGFFRATLSSFPRVRN